MMISADASRFRIASAAEIPAMLPPIITWRIHTPLLMIVQRQCGYSDNRAAAHFNVQRLAG
jgi:hypothetical protein